ncbi:DNA-3-methyladenine glycosylase family protein [Peribacillus sp. JNUCC 23]|uniref:DNA-3-methyladenine glycosylase family protein n=1 Tax=Peribacillus sp. NPDC096379 TaxID=3364393 RepID=UPI00382E10B0
MQWSNHGSFIEIHPPKEFNFEECLVFLGRSHKEVLHQIRDGLLYKLIKVNGELILCRIGFTQDVIHVDFPIHPLSITSHEEVVAYIWEWFDLDQDLSLFYEVANQDKILQQIHKRYYGLRMMCIPDLFEALTWAIMGQQINLTFAYKLKQRFVEHFGECLTFEGNPFWLYPTYERIATLGIEELRTLQFTVRKAEYVIGVAKAMRNGELTKEMLLQEPAYQQAQKSLLAIRGVGAWTADYVLMKCLHHPSAFPIADVGLHNALKLQLGLERKPTIAEIKEVATNWEGWQAYATFYLWRSLYE